MILTYNQLGQIWWALRDVGNVSEEKLAEEIKVFALQSCAAHEEKTGEECVPTFELTVTK